MHGKLNLFVEQIAIMNFVHISRYDCNERLKLVDERLLWSCGTCLVFTVISSLEIVNYILKDTTWIDWMLTMRWGKLINELMKCFSLIQKVLLK